MRSALNHLQKSAIIILDIKLRENHNSRELISSIRSRFANVAIVMCSDLNDAATVQQSLDWGADDFIFKGLDEESLAKRLSSLFKAYAMNLSAPERLNSLPEL